MHSAITNDEIKQELPIRYSIIICAYNAADRIENTLLHLSKLNYLKNFIEIILVDNNSTDSTAKKSLLIWNSLGNPFAFQIILETRQGLSFARESGMGKANGKNIVFCDDDNWLSADYLNTADDVFNKYGDKCIIGGACIPALSSEKIKLPAFFYAYASWYAVGCHTFRLKDITDSVGWVYGAGMILPKEAYLFLKKKNIRYNLTDRKGDQLSSGGDIEICLALRLSNWKIISQPLLELHHFMPEKRLSIEYLERLISANSETAAGIYPYKILYDLKNLRSRSLSLRIRSIVSIILNRKYQPYTTDAACYILMGKTKTNRLPVNLIED